MPHHGIDQYDNLPEIIRESLTRKEYAWMTDAQKQNLVQEMTEPDDDAEDGAW